MGRALNDAGNGFGVDITSVTATTVLPEVSPTVVVCAGVEMVPLPPAAEAQIAVAIRPAITPSRRITHHRDSGLSDETVTMLVLTFWGSPESPACEVVMCGLLLGVGLPVDASGITRFPVLAAETTFPRGAGLGVGVYGSAVSQRNIV